MCWLGAPKTAPKKQQMRELALERIFLNNFQFTLPKTNSSHLKIGNPNRKGSYSNYPFSGAFAVSRVYFWMTKLHSYSCIKG